ncbi:MAG: hydroxyacid dehydrogenase [Clostridia bacterium]|nr:hydroxyacid dehydrogenase [Clostridia bacterium]
MKAAFISNSDGIIDRVYSKEAQSCLKQKFDFYEGVYTIHNSDGLKDVECIFSTWGMPAYTPEHIDEYFPKLKIVFYGAGSVQAFARPFLNKGIPVISAWMANSVPVVEYAVSQIVLANKGFYQVTSRLNSREERDESRALFNTYTGNFNTKVGLIGLGAIGAGVAEMLKNYKLDVYAYDPFCSEEKAKKLEVTLTTLEYIFENCQTISNHCANLPETQNILNGALFNRMKKNATFINTGRGAQVVEADLISALRDEPDRTAVLDVTFPEPPEPDSPLYTMKNVFLTPHIAGSAGDECMRMGDYMVDEAARYLNGEPLKYEVTLKMLETMA